LAFKPPFSDLPSLRCHAGDFAIMLPVIQSKLLMVFQDVLD
jgi:hypothetical protein